MPSDSDILDLFHGAADLAPEAQAEFIESRCPDPEVRLRLERLLRLDRERSETFMRSPVQGLALDAQDLAGEVVADRYRIVRILGEGGMGVVYLAEQERPGRRVALKLIRPSLMTERQIRRFELEAELLARLQHPGIARIYDAGTARIRGVACPYFAMEYIEGLPLLEHAATHHLGTRGRLELFVQICDAIEHAHQRGVIHRDLKPGNVLIDGAGSPKVLDFGVGRAVDAQNGTLLTESGQLIGTVAYMSPEQVLGTPGAADTRTDVYALGVLLYELLVGRPPHDVRGLALPAAARMVAEAEPTGIGTVNRAFRGDLDTIVRKALEKDPARRYRAVAELSADVRRVMDNEPILARPATTLYQLRKFARRNRGLVAGLAATILVLVAGVIVSTVLAIGQTRALAESEHQRKIAEAVNGFLTEDLVELADPNVESDRELTLASALDRAVGRMARRFADAPEAEAALSLSIGTAYSHLHRLDDAQRHLTRARDLYVGLGGELDERVLLCRMELASVLMKGGGSAEAEPVWRELLALQRRSLGDDHEQTMASISNLGVALLNQGRFAEAEPLLDEARERRTRVLGEGDAQTATTQNNLGVLYLYTQRFEEAAQLLEGSLGVLREANGERHPQTLQTMANLGMARHRSGDVDAAVRALEEALPLHRSVLGERHRSTLSVASSLASLYGIAGLNDKREALLTRTLATQNEVLGPDHLDTLVTRMNLAKVGYDRRQYDVAEPEYAALGERFAALYPDHFLGAIVRTMHGRCLMELARYAEAQREFSSAYDQIVATLGPNHGHAREIATTLADLFTRWDKPDEAAMWRAIAAGDQPPG